MNIVIVHCHYERGGVTQVVENHVRWLEQQDEIDRILLVSGGRTSGLRENTIQTTQLVELPGFEYDSIHSESTTLLPLDFRVSALVAAWNEQMQAAGISPSDSIVHWHNHSLGKNVAAPLVIRHLAESGWRFLLQIHDFAEDSRGDNYAHLIAGTGATRREEIDSVLYPVASQIHYATLTRFDASVLSKVGVPEPQTHCLPNSVAAASETALQREPSLETVRQVIGLPSDATWCLYPVRGIRRKNVGEFLMLSRMTPSNCYSGLTLCPATPVEKRSYRRWQDLAQQVAPRAVFDAAHHAEISFADNLAASRYILSTSVAEGFGMAFLEPWLSKREVIARRLPTVTSDFENAGVRLPKLYDAIPIPGPSDWIQQCRQENAAMLAQAWQAIPSSLRPTVKLVSTPIDDAIDFAELTPARQIEVLQRIDQDAGFESAVLERSRELVRWLHDEPDMELIEHNWETVANQYALGTTGEQLHAIYRTLLDAPLDADCKPPENAGQALPLIQGARPFFPCRAEPLDHD